jgi:hypothetical protein
MWHKGEGGHENPRAGDCGAGGHVAPGPPLPPLAPLAPLAPCEDLVSCSEADGTLIDTAVV